MSFSPQGVTSKTKVKHMSKLANLNIANHLNHFSSLHPEVKQEIVSDIASLLGKEESNMVSKVGGWKMSSKCILQSKEGHKLALPANNPAVILLKFGMQLSEIADNGEMEVNAEIPKLCEAWITQKSIRIAARRSDKTEPATA